MVGVKGVIVNASVCVALRPVNCVWPAIWPSATLRFLKKRWVFIQEWMIYILDCHAVPETTTMRCETKATLKCRSSITKSNRCVTKESTWFHRDKRPPVRMLWNPSSFWFLQSPRPFPPAASACSSAWQETLLMWKWSLQSKKYMACFQNLSLLNIYPW